jgi:hypothetical protein
MTRKRFLVCIDRFDAPDGRVWAVADYVRRRLRWRTTRAVELRVPCTTRFRGRHATQPKAYLSGVGRIAWHVERTVIHGR